MDPSLEEHASLIKGLAERIKELEGRLAALEVRDAARPENMNIFSVAVPAAHPTPLPASHPLKQIADGGSAGVMPVIGKVFLGLAGAYVLRALAESAALPQITVAVAALFYSAGWLVWAGRSSFRFASGAYGVTASLIVFPLLWEATVRFKILPALLTAAILLGFVLLAFFVAWKKDLAAVAWLTTSFAVITALGLFVGTGNPAPFALALLLIAASAECAYAMGHWLPARVIAALAADVGMLMLLALYTSRELSPEYVRISVPALLAFLAALFLISTVSTLFATVVRQQPINYFSVFQTTVTFLIVTVGSLRATHGAAQLWIGALCIVAAAISYLAAFTWFDEDRLVRNYHVFATWAAALLTYGAFLSFSLHSASAWLCLATLVSIAAAVRTSRVTLAAHSLAFLAGAIFSSGFLTFAFAAVVADRPQPATFTIVIAAVAAICSYGALCKLATQLYSTLVDRAVRFCFATLGAMALFALLVGTAAQLVSPNPPLLASIRTFLLCLLALSCGFAGSRYSRPELLPLGYGLMAVCTLKLLFEDLRAGSAAWLAISLFVYGLVWVLLPRITKSSTAEQAPPEEQSKAKRMAG